MTGSSLFGSPAFRECLRRPMRPVYGASMSADNWAMCPRCSDRLAAEILAAEAKAEASYGAVSVAEFDALRQAAGDLREQKMDPTFREDYEFGGAAEGELTIDYEGSCAVCGLVVSHHGTVPFYRAGGAQ